METKRKALGRGLEELFNSESLQLDKIENRIMEDVTKDLNRIFKKLATPLTEIMNVDAARKGVEL